VTALLKVCVRWLYGTLMTCLQPLLRRKVMQRGKAEPGYLVFVEERFGRYAGPVAPAQWVWVHAVSLGETRAAAVLVAALRQRLPGMRLLLTHGTATGRAEGRSLLRDGDIQVWQPWDAPSVVDRFLTHFQPRVGVLMETEVWPELAFRCQARGVPLVLVNARLSEKSLRNARRLAWLARPAYAALTAVYAQSDADAERLRVIGADVQGVFGNLKFDAAPDAGLLAQGVKWRDGPGAVLVPIKPVVVFASSREGEEALFLQSLGRLPAAQRHAAQWMIVPRHPQRFDDVARLIAAAGFTVSRRSDWPEAGPVQGVAPDIWLGDSLGEMPSYYSMSTLAFLGGSFLPLGGQNLIEAAACGCPVVMGPHTFNFAESAQRSADTGAALRVDDMDAAFAAALALLTQPQRLDHARNATMAFVRLHRGAVDRTAAALIAKIHAGH